MHRDPEITKAIPRCIIGFHQDEEQHWVADLECGHTQHVRHDPPWQVRPWVTTESGRTAFIGQSLDCVKCGIVPLRVAAFQRRPLFDDVAGTIERLSADLAWCDDHGVQLAVFPECYLQGYASDRRTIVHRALSLNSEMIGVLLAKLARYQTTTVLGLIEQREAKFYNTAAVIRQGNVIGAYAKCHTNERGFDAGYESPVFETTGWTFGINICYDANFPEAATNLSQQGARVLCYPLNNMLLPRTAAKWRPKSIENLQQRAIETKCWVVSSDVVGEYGGKMSYGCTCIVQPNGAIVRRADEGTEQTIVFDLI